MLTRASSSLRAFRSSNVFRGFSSGAEAADAQFLLRNYNKDGTRAKKGMVLDSGNGSVVKDEDGNEYIDLASGIAVAALGYNHPALTKVISEQSAKLMHASNLFHSRPPLELAEMLIDASCFDKVFFCNSGTEANEGALKIARKYQLTRSGGETQTLFECGKAQCATVGGRCHCWTAPPHRTKVLAFKSGFHGRTMGALSATHKPAIRNPFAPLVHDVAFAEYNDMKSVHDLYSYDIGTVIVEAIQGEGGIRRAEPAFLKDLRQWTEENDIVLIMDEVQSGLGRSGRLWAHEAYDIEPDMMTLAKPLAGGLPIGAVLIKEKFASSIIPGDHGTTFGGNPLVCAAAKVVMNEINTEIFLSSVRSKGEHLIKRCHALQAKFPSLVSSIRHPIDPALFVGVQMTQSPAPVQQHCADNGVLLITAGVNTLRLCPPLIITEAELDRAMDVVEEGLAELAAAQ